MDKKIDFLIIAPLEEEREALLTHLPAAQRLPASDDDIRIYYQAMLAVDLGASVHGNYRLIITSPNGMGRVEAATVTLEAIRKFAPRYVLLVGIAGGCPPDVSLGDILIADQFVDYEIQKVTDQGTQVRYQAYRSDPRLFLAAQHLRDWESLIKVARPDEDRPRRHSGIVVSGDKIQAKKGSLAAYRADWPKLIGVEMEAGGVAAAAWQSALKPGVLMIRSVSDLADTKKNSSRVKLWRPYACDAAAAFLITLLRSGPVPFHTGL